MNRQHKTITLSYPHYTVKYAGGTEKVYRVVRVTDSTAYEPDQYMTKAEVNALCEATSWRVIIVGVKP